MKFYSTPSFLKHYEKLDPQKRNNVKESIDYLINLFATGLNPKGLGLKQLRRNLWELRSSLKDRVLFQIENDTARFILVGNHDDVRKYLRNL